MKRGLSIARYLLPRLQDIFFFSLMFGAILLGPRLLNTDGDLGRHLTIGGYILDTHAIPTHDIFSHTLSGAPLTPHEWLAEVCYTLAYRLKGLNGVVLFSALLIALTFVMVYRATARTSQTLLLALGISFWAAAASSLHWIARPHLFTFLLLAIWTSRLGRVTHSETPPLWQFPLIMLLWANLHGAFIAGFVVWGAMLAGQLWDERKITPLTRTLLLIGGLSFLATFINPAGWHLWETSLGYLQNSYLVGHTQEYFSPDFHNPGTWPFLGLVALSLLALSRSGKRLSAANALLLAGWTAMSLVSTLNIPLYAIVIAPILAGLTSAGLEKIAFWERLENLFANMETLLRGFIWSCVAFALALLLLLSPATLATRNTFDPTVFPVQAADWLEANPQSGNMFNYFSWGGYLLHHLWPEQKVFIDGQTDFYGEALTRQYEQVITLAEGWEDVLAAYDVTWVIMPINSPLTRQLNSRSEWQILYQDETAIILRKATSP